jgi:hypothetical protein
MSNEKYPANASDVDETGLQNVDPQPLKRKPWWKLGGKDSSFVSVNAGYARSAISTSSSETKLDTSENLGNHVWETEDAKEVYKPIAGYEGSHRFDPSFQWEPAEEKALVKTVSLDPPYLTRVEADNKTARLAHCVASLHYVFCPSA